jgi:hypothetical protein
MKKWRLTCFVVSFFLLILVLFGCEEVIYLEDADTIAEYPPIVVEKPMQAPDVEVFNHPSDNGSKLTVAWTATEIEREAYTFQEWWVEVQATKKRYEYCAKRIQTELAAHPEYDSTYKEQLNKEAQAYETRAELLVKKEKRIYQFNYQYRILFRECASCIDMEFQEIARIEPDTSFEVDHKYSFYQMAGLDRHGYEIKGLTKGTAGLVRLEVIKREPEKEATEVTAVADVPPSIDCYRGSESMGQTIFAGSQEATDEPEPEPEAEAEEQPSEPEDVLVEGEETVLGEEDDALDEGEDTVPPEEEGNQDTPSVSAGIDEESQTNETTEAGAEEGVEEDEEIAEGEKPEEWEIGDQASEVASSEEEGKSTEPAGPEIIYAVDPEPAAPAAEWMYGYKLNALIMIVIICGVILFFIQLARKNPNLFLRRIAGLEAVDEAVGRATEMGKAVYFVHGLVGLAAIPTIASINILGKIAEKIAEYNAQLKVTNYDPLVMAVSQETVKESYSKAGRPDAYNEDNVFFVASDQFAYAAAIDGMIVRERPGAIFYMGYFFAESLLLAETGVMTGAIQIAGTDAYTQLPFFITTCDYTLMGEELYAASAYLSREPRMLGSIRGMDIGKLILMIYILVGVVLYTIHPDLAIFREILFPIG